MLGVLLGELLLPNLVGGAVGAVGGGGGARRDEDAGRPIAETTTSLYKSPGLLRRLWAVVAGSTLAIM